MDFFALRALLRLFEKYFYFFWAMEVWKLIASNWYLAFSEQFEVERKKKYGFDVLMKTHFHALFFFFSTPKNIKELHDFACFFQQNEWWLYNMIHIRYWPVHFFWVSPIFVNLWYFFRPLPSSVGEPFSKMDFGTKIISESI